MNETTAIKEKLPLLMSSKEAPSLGLTKSAFYTLTHREDVPTVVIGSRRFLHRDKFFEWLEKEADQHLA